MDRQWPSILRPFRPGGRYLAYVDGRPRHEGVRRFLAARGVQLLEGSPTDPPGALTVHGLGVHKDALFVQRMRLVGFSVREPGPAAPRLDVEHYHRLLANAADFIIDRLDAEVVFFPMERRTFDVQHSHGVVGQMSHAQRATVLKRDYTPGQILSLLEHFEFTVGMRLHFLIFSALAGVPFVGLPYATKVAGFLEELRLTAPVLEHVSAGQLIAHIDRAWDQREELRARIRQALPGLQERARSSNEIAVIMLTRPERHNEVAPPQGP